MSALQYSWYFFEALIKSMAQYLIESCKVKVSVCHKLCVLTLAVSLQVGVMTAEVVYSRPRLAGSRSTTDRVLWIRSLCDSVVEFNSLCLFIPH